MKKRINEKYKKTFFNTIMLYLLAIAKIIFPLVTLPYLTRVLSVETYGAIAYVKSIIAYAQTAIDFGFILSAVRDIVNINREKEETSRVVGNTIVAKLFLAVISFIVILILSFVIPILRDYTLLLFLSFIPPLLSCFLLDFFFRGIEKMHIVSIIFVLMKTISTLLTILLIKGDQQVLLVPIFDTVSSLCAIVVTWIIYKKLGYSIKVDGIKAAFKKIKESFLFFANSATSSVFGALTTAVIGVCVNDLQDVAYWSVSIQLIGAVQAMYTPLSHGLYPYMIKGKDLKLIKIVLLIFMPIVIVGSIIVGCISPSLLTIVGGENYEKAATVFRYLLPVLVISFPVAILGWPTLGSIEKTKQINLATLSGAVAQILGLVVLYVIGCFSIVNVAIMRNLSEFIMFAVLLFFVIKYRKQFALEPKNNQSLNGDDNTNK